VVEGAWAGVWAEPRLSADEVVALVQVVAECLLGDRRREDLRRHRISCRSACQVGDLVVTN